MRVGHQAGCVAEAGRGTEDDVVTLAQCTSAHGGFMPITGWMVHAWVVPGWESPKGVFSHENPDLPCADGTFHTDKVARCQGS